MALSRINANSITDDSITVDQIADTAVHGRRNLIINGSFQVFQRATAATTADGGYNTADRWRMGESGDGAYTTERSTDHPNGSGYSLKAQVTTADTSVAAGHYAYIYQQIEAQNLQHLLYGTSAAKTLTLSFWVKSNKTGTYVFDLRKPDTTHLHYNEEFTISSADTWEKKTITIVPDSNVTASGGAIANDTGSGLEVGIGLRWGSTYTGGTSGSWSTNSNDYGTSNQVNWMDSTSNNFYLTEVQLEVSDKATPFEHRSFGEELQLCRRYYEQYSADSGRWLAAGGYKGTDASEYVLLFNVQKRATPTVSFTGTSSDFLLKRLGTSNAAGGTLSADNIGPDMVKITSASNPSTHTTGQASLFGVYQTAKVIIDGEL